MADSTLGAIRTKVRRLTRSPSTAQLSDAAIDEYVNTFFLYDMPEHLRLFSLRTVVTFFTQPFEDFYPLSTTTDEFGDLMLNKYITFHDPVYIAGYKSVFTQSEAQFYNLYPRINHIAQEATGDGVTAVFNGTLTNTPVQRNNVTFTSSYTGGLGISVGLVLRDDGATLLTGDGFGTINYETGAYSLTFNNPPGNGIAIQSQTYPFVAARPDTILYYDNSFFFRPIPDQPYRVDIEAYRVPTELLQAGQNPELQQWWQYIAYGAAKKVFEDRIDMESVQTIMPEFKQQELLVLRRTIVQHSNERVATIYTENVDGGYTYSDYFGRGSL